MLRALVIGLALFLVIYLIERAYRVPDGHYRSRGFLHDVAYWFYYRSGLHHFVFLAALFAALSGPLAALDLRLLSPLPYWLQALLYMVVADFLVYWIHRAQHHFPFLWAFHTTHHSQQHLSFATSQRVHPVDHLVQDILIFVPLRILGFDEAAWIPMYLLGEFNLAAQHSRIPWRFGLLYRIIVSPVFHSFHHSLDSAHHNRNFAGLFSLWDYAFGTAVRDERAAPAQFGLPSMAPTSVVSTLVAPIRLLRESYSPKSPGGLSTNVRDQRGR
jgi:sterol desaturase/sphingolipid hydroxylase (fatty acid hydroxylase superfamily)